MSGAGIGFNCNVALCSSRPVNERIAHTAFFQKIVSNPALLIHLDEKFHFSLDGINSAISRVKFWSSLNLSSATIPESAKITYISSDGDFISVILDTKYVASFQFSMLASGLMPIHWVSCLSTFTTNGSAERLVKTKDGFVLCFKFPRQHPSNDQVHFVTDSGYSRRQVIFQPDGSAIFSDIADIATNADLDTVFVLDRGNNAIVVLNQVGDIQYTIHDRLLQRPRGLCLDDAGNIYASCDNNDIIQIGDDHSQSRVLLKENRPVYMQFCKETNMLSVLCENTQRINIYRDQGLGGYVGSIDRYRTDHWRAIVGGRCIVWFGIVMLLISLVRLEIVMLLVFLVLLLILPHDNHGRVQGFL